MANEKNLILPSDPKANYLVHKEEIDSAIHNVLDSGKYILGQQVRSFEKEFADYLDLEFAIGVGSGTEALHLALLACGIKSGDTVITVSHTAVATVAAIELSGAKPFLVDIDELSYNMDPVLLEKAIVENVNRGIKPKAVVAVHLYGYPANMPEIIDIAKRYDFRVIEDCAQSHGASIGGKLTGSWSDIAAFSFYPTKNLSALGDAGAVVTSDHALVEKVRLLREYGWKERYFSDICGFNSRLDELQAAVLRVKLKFLDKENSRRNEIAKIYDDALSATALRLPRVVVNDIVHAYHQYAVRTSKRDALRNYLKDNGVETLIHYPMPVHQQKAYFGRLDIASGGLNNTEKVCKEILSLPMHPHMSDEQAWRVAGLILDWSEK